MKKSILICCTMFFACNVFAQCSETITNQRLRPGMFFYGNAAGSEKMFVGKVNKADDKEFSLTFIHSGNTYAFTYPVFVDSFSKSLMHCTVIDNGKGIFPPGTMFTGNFFVNDPDSCDLSLEPKVPANRIIVTFDDKKKYLGLYRIRNEKYEVLFPHSGSFYIFDKNWKAISVTGGGYAVGTKVQVVHARRLMF